MVNNKTKDGAVQGMVESEVMVEGNGEHSVPFCCLVDR